jgi:3-hydroxyacyl-[acyl-carrier-protein] dehydratase
MLDRLLALEPGVSASAERLVTTASGDFPQVYLLECIAQLAGIASIHEEGDGGFLASIDHAEFEGEVMPGDTLTITARVLKTFGRLVLIEGDVASKEHTLIRAQLTLGIGKL